MSWTYLTDVSFTNGSDTVQVYDNVDLSGVLSSWALYTGSGQFVEITSGTAFNAGSATLTLAKPWATATELNVPAAIVPTTAILESLLEQIAQTEGIINQLTGQFPVLLGDGSQRDWGILVDASGDGYEVVPKAEFLFRLGLLDELQTMFDDASAHLIDASVQLARLWASGEQNEEPDSDGYPGLYSARHYAYLTQELNRDVQVQLDQANTAAATAISQADRAQTQANNADFSAAAAEQSKLDAETAEANTEALLVGAQSAFADIAVTNNRQDAELDAIRTVDSTQTNRLNAIDTKNATQDNRLTALENEPDNVWVGAGAPPTGTKLHIELLAGNKHTVWFYPSEGAP